jgi:transcriptional regulator with XRE-family HTH domain
VDGAPAHVQTAALLGQRLVVAMKDDGRSARQLAYAAGLDPGTLSRILAGHAIPDLGTLAALEHALNTDLWPGLNPNS